MHWVSADPAEWGTINKVMTKNKERIVPFIDTILYETRVQFNDKSASCRVVHFVENGGTCCRQYTVTKKVVKFD